MFLFIASSSTSAPAPFGNPFIVLASILFTVPLIDFPRGVLDAITSKPNFSKAPIAIP